MKTQQDSNNSSDQHIHIMWGRILAFLSVVLIMVGTLIVLE